MNSETLLASVQYGDLAGTSAADYHDDSSKAKEIAAKHGLDLTNRRVLAYRLSYGENRIITPAKDRVILSFLCAVAPPKGDTSGNQFYEELDIKTTLTEAFDLFKRVEVVFTSKLTPDIVKPIWGEDEDEGSDQE